MKRLGWSVGLLVGVGVLLLIPAGVAQGAGVQDVVVQQSTSEPDPAPTDPIGMDEFGVFPRDRYEISCDEGSWNMQIRKFICTVQGWPFGISKTLTGLSGTVLGWSMGTSLTGALTDAAGEMAGAYNVGLVGSLNLRHLAWTVAIFYCAWLLLQRQTSRAVGEFAVTVAAAFLGAWMITSPAGYLTGYIATIEAINNQLAVAANGESSASLTQSVQIRMHQSFIAEPYDLLNWGSPLTGKCAETRDEILKTGPHGNDDKPRDMMEAAGCDDAKKFNNDPSFARFGGGSVLGLGSSVMAVLMLLLAFGVQIFQLLLLPLWVGMPVVLTLAMMPGGGRRLLGWWFGANLGVGLLYLSTTLVLVFVTSAAQVLLTSQGEMGIMKRMFLLDCTIAIGFKLRKVAIASAKKLGQSFGDTVNRAMPAKSPYSGWAGLHASDNPLGDMMRTMPGGRRYEEVTNRHRTRRAGKRRARALRRERAVHDFGKARQKDLVNAGRSAGSMAKSTGQAVGGTGVALARNAGTGARLATRNAGARAARLAGRVKPW